MFDMSRDRTSDAQSLMRRRPAAAPPIVHDVLRSAGQPLDAASRAYFEPRFGHDFSKVRVHADAQAATSARAVDAQAYTVGSQIAFDSGRYAPGSAEGRGLLAHELAHVVQQRSQGSQVPDALEVGPVGGPHEAAAERAAARLSGGGTVGAAPASVARMTLQRACGPKEIGKPPGCAKLSGDAPGDRFLFKVNCDTFLNGTAALAALAKTFPAGESVEVHGFSSVEGDAEFNENLSCARAIAAVNVMEANVSGVAFSLFAHGATAGDRETNRSVTVIRKSGAPQDSCGPANQVERIGVSVEHVVIADDDGKNPTAPTSISIAQRIWNKCCIDLTLAGVKTVKKTAFNTLDESPNDTPTAQEAQLFAAAPASHCIQVFVPRTLTQGGVVGKDVSGGGGTYFGGTANPRIVLVEGALGEVLAHEIGHAMGYLTHDPGPTVMRPTGHFNVPNAAAVSPAICATTRNGPVGVAKGDTSACCQST